MSYTHTLGALNLQTGPLPACAPADVIADARIACNVASSVRGLGALTSMLSLPPAVRPYADNPAWAQFPSCDVERLPVCPQVSAVALTYKVPATVATYTAPKVSATVATYQPVVTGPAPSLTAVAPRAPTLTTVAPRPPTLTTVAPRPPTLTSAPPGSVVLMKISPTAKLVALPGGGTAIVEAGMSGAAKAGLLALVALGAYGIYRSQKKG